MKVIKSLLSTVDWPKRCVCEECGAELEYMADDVHVGWMGVEYVTCPECGRETVVGDKRKAKPTWPLTFHHTCQENGAVDIETDEVNNMIDKIVEYLQNSKENWNMSLRATGNTMVIGWKNSDGIDIYVTKNYWEDTIFND